MVEVNFENTLTAIISIIVSIGIFFIIKIILKAKLGELKGSFKLVRLFSLIIIIVEAVYLGLVFNILEVAASVIASLGVAFALVTFALQNHLKNIISGINIYLSPEINVGDLIEIDGKKGVIIDFHLTRTTALTEDGQRIFIPNLKFYESVSILYPKKKEN